MSWDDTNYDAAELDARDADVWDPGDSADDTGVADADDDINTADVTVVLDIQTLDVDERLTTVRSQLGDEVADAMEMIRAAVDESASEIGKTAYLELLVSLTEDASGPTS